MVNIDEVIKYFPSQLYQLLKNVSVQNQAIESNLQEIRIRVNRPIILKLRQADILIDYKISQTEILQTLERLCENSIYAYKNQICNGYLTIKGGHRIGITGTAVVEYGKVINLKYVTSLNFRIARQILGCSNRFLKEIINKEDNTIYNTLIVSPPGKGKTTILRDAIRRISNGIEEMNFNGKTCGVVDERGEIAAMYKGIPQNDLGERADILDNVSKDIGMKMLVRSMSPKVIVADEIGTKEDIEAINYAVTSGVKGIFTAHGDSLENITLNPILSKLYNLGILERIILIEEKRNVKLIFSK